MECNMNKSILTIATILSLGTMGCASVGTQYAGTTTAAETASVQYATGGLGTLWESSESQPKGVSQSVASKQFQSDLWTPASVTRPSETNPEKRDPRTTFRKTSTSLKF